VETEREEACYILCFPDGTGSYTDSSIYGHWTEECSVFCPMTCFKWL
jgi:hypothetical protein